MVGRRDRRVLTLPVPVVGGDAVSDGQLGQRLGRPLGQRGRVHGRHPAASPASDRSPRRPPCGRTRHTGEMSTDELTTTQPDADAYRIEHDTMGEVRVPRDALYQAQTQRAIENFPISGTPIEPAVVHALGRDQGRGRAGQRPARRRAVRDRRQDRRRGGRGRRRTARRGVPDRRLPDRIRHVDQHERQRGHRDPRLARRLADPPQRPRQRLAEQQRRLPDRRASRHDRGHRSGRSSPR